MIVRVMGAEHGNLAAKCTAGGEGFPRHLVHHQGDDKVAGRAVSERNDGVFCPFAEGGFQALVAARTALVLSDSDGLVKVPEELERDARDLELTEPVPGFECVEDLFGDIERRKVLHLGANSLEH